MNALEYLNSLTKPGLKWVLRNSSSGRGMRLHQTRNVNIWEEDATQFGLAFGGGDTPEEAILDHQKNREDAA